MWSVQEGGGRAKSGTEGGVEKPWGVWSEPRQRMEGLYKGVTPAPF